MATLAADGSVLDTWFPAPELGSFDEPGTVRLSVAEIPVELAELAGRDEDRGTEIVPVRTVIGAPTTCICACTCSRIAWSPRTA